MGAAETFYIAGDLRDLGRRVIILPAFHAFIGPAIFYRTEDVADAAAMKPGVVGQVRAYATFAMLAMAGKTGAFEDGLTCRQVGRRAQELHRILIHIIGGLL